MSEKEKLAVPQRKKKSKKEQTDLRKSLLKKVYDKATKNKDIDVEGDSQLCIGSKISKKPAVDINLALLSVRETAVLCKEKAIEIPWNIASSSKSSKGILIPKNFPTFANVKTQAQCEMYEVYFRSILKVWMSLTRCLLEYSKNIKRLKEAYLLLPKQSEAHTMLKDEYCKEVKYYKENIVHPQFSIVQRQLVLLLILITKFDNSMCLKFHDNFKTLLKNKSYILKNFS